MDHLTRDPVGLRRAEKGDKRSDVAWKTHSTPWDSVRIELVMIARALLVPRHLDNSGSDGVDPHSTPSELNGERSRQSIDSTLGRRVCRKIGHRDSTVNRRDVDDRSIAIHEWDRSLRTGEVGLEIDIEKLSQISDRGCKKGALERPAGIVDECIEATETRDRLLDEPRAGRGIAKVGAQRNSNLADFSHQLERFNWIGRSGVNGHAGTA